MLEHWLQIKEKSYSMLSNPSTFIVIFLNIVLLAWDAKTATLLDVTPFLVKVTFFKLIFYIVAFSQ